MSAAVLLALFLFTILLVAQVFGRWTALSRDNPLDVDDGLPLPWAGYATTAFSLTGVFAAYLGAFLFFGFPALLGIVSGVTFGLLFVRGEIKKFFVENSRQKSFQDFLLTRKFTSDLLLNTRLWIALALGQLGIAISEVALFREVAIRGFDLSPKHATALVLSVALVSYCYCLLGGYNALFRADVAQFIAMISMCLLLGYVLVQSQTLVPSLVLQAKADTASMNRLWTFGFNLGSPFRWGIYTVVGFAMGAALLVATPDTWKRVFLSQQRETDRKSFSAMLLAGALPFLVLAPLGLQLGPLPNMPIFPLDLLQGLNTGVALNALLLGMTASFMSTLDSALVSAAHLILVLPRPSQPATMSNLEAYRFFLGIAFAIVVVTSLALFSHSNNPYIVGNFLVGPFAILSGLIIGTSMLRQGFLAPVMSVVVLVLIMFWIVYFVSLLDATGVASKASPVQASTFPVGAIILIISAAAARYFRSKSEGRA